MRDLGVAGVVAAALGQVPGGEADDGQQEQRGRHHDAPPALAEVGEREGHQAEPGPERARRRR